jgi:hypothetical protein
MALARGFCRSQIDEFAKATPDPTSGSLLGVFRKATLERNPTPLSKSPKEKGHWYYDPCHCSEAVAISLEN